jgi:Rod binding domain-containing protein
MTNPIAAANAATLGEPASKDSPAKILDAAKQFESLLIAQMMKSMHDSEGGCFGTDGDESSSAAMEYGQEAFAQSMAQGGGLGLASLVAKGLTKPQA